MTRHDFRDRQRTNFTDPNRIKPITESAPQPEQRLNNLVAPHRPSAARLLKCKMTSKDSQYLKLGLPGGRSQRRIKKVNVSVRKFKGKVGQVET